MALNGGHVPQDLDPFRHSEAFLSDFLKTQGMLKAPLIKHLASRQFRVLPSINPGLPTPRDDPGMGVDQG